MVGPFQVSSVYKTRPRPKHIESMEIAVKPDDCVARGSAIVFLNGEILGTHCNPRDFICTMKQLRRAGHLGHFVNVYTQQDCVYIASDGGRVCRPLIVCDSGVPRLTDDHITKVNLAEMQAHGLNFHVQNLSTFGDCDFLPESSS